MDVIINNGYLIIIKPDKNEFKEHTINRGIFIAKQKPKNIEEYNDLVVYSRVHNNIKYNKSGYNKLIINKLINYCN